MNSSANQPRGITSFTDGGGSGNQNSLSSALAETVANLACFGNHGGGRLETHSGGAALSDNRVGSKNGQAGAANPPSAAPAATAGAAGKQHKFIAANNNTPVAKATPAHRMSDKKPLVSKTQDKPTILQRSLPKTSEAQDMGRTVHSLQNAFQTPNKRKSNHVAIIIPPKKDNRCQTTPSGPIISGTAFASMHRTNGKGSPNSTHDESSCHHNNNINNNSCKKSIPIIAGTAAAAMAIATAARIATENKHGFTIQDDSAFDTIAGMRADTATATTATTSHTSNKSRMKQQPAVVIPRTLSNTGVRITPKEDDTTAVSRMGNEGGVPIQSSIRAIQPMPYLNASHMSTTTTTTTTKKSSPSKKNGMDILADIISHVPPMTVPYPSMSIPSYQEIYQEMGIQVVSNDSSATTIGNSNFPNHRSYSNNCPQLLSRLGVYSGGEDRTATNHFQQQQQQQNNANLQYHYGHPMSGEIEEGKELYTRKDLLGMGGHLAEFRDVHGSMKEGADSVVLCNLERDIREGDGLCWFLYSCDRTNGGGALCRSYHKKRAIRIFRSSTLNGKFASPYLDEDEDDEIGYRYDGLYTIGAVWDIHGNETEAFPCAGAEGWQTYFFTRLPKKPLDGRTEPGMQYNTVGLQELWGCIQKMRGVKRPKKFEIPPAPMKLPPMKLNAITGDYKDRKSVSYRPPPEQEQLAEKPKKQNPPVFDSSSDEEAPEPPRGPTKRSESVGPSREKSPKMAPRPMPNKVVTPRPRMSSISEEVKKTPASPSAKRMASTESDSSDSETEISAPAKRTKVESPKLNSMYPTKRPNNLAQVISTLLPKRATAAKAEAANRDMLGKMKKRQLNRKSTAAASPRKRSRRSKRDDDSSTSSIDGIDPDILTIGSRVLVLYKGSLFKATIRKRREKNGKHDFQIHYDGNKRSNVHWVPSDRIQKILFVAIDTNPAKKTAGGKKAKRGGWNRKKSVESDAEDDSDHSEDESVHESNAQEEDAMASESKSETLESPESTSLENKAESDEAPALDLNAEDATESEAPIFDDDIVQASLVDAPRDVSSVDDEEILRKETNDDSIATTSTTNSKRNRVTVFEDVEVARESSTSPKSTKKKKLLHKSSTMSSNDADAPSIDLDSTSDNEEQIDEEHEELSEQEKEIKFPVGTHVYVEYRRIFYTSKVLQTRRKRKLIEYLVHYQGYKKASDRWVKESSLHEVNAETTRRFEEQRPSSSTNDTVQSDLSGPADSTMTTRGKSNALDAQIHQHFTRLKKPPSRARSDTSDNFQLVDLESGVAFLPGSVVFVEWSGALYLAKMLKKRFSGERTEYLVSYDGYDSDYDAWNSIHNIYEVNPQTKRVFNKMNAEIKSGSKSKRPDPPKSRPDRKNRESTSTRSTSTVKTEKEPNREKEIFSSPPLPRRRGARKKQDDDSISFSDQISKQSSAATPHPSIDMQGIPPGVEFLPGSTLFAERKGTLCLAKMLKKRGKGDFMEYFVQFNDGKDDNESMWISTAHVYEINPQTKRMFRQLSKG